MPKDTLTESDILLIGWKSAKRTFDAAKGELLKVGSIFEALVTDWTKVYPAGEPEPMNRPPGSIPISFVPQDWPNGTVIHKRLKRCHEVFGHLKLFYRQLPGAARKDLEDRGLTTGLTPEELKILAWPRAVPLI